MKKLLFGICLTLLACGQNSHSQQHNKKNTIPDKYLGIYEYVDPYNKQDSSDNQYIVLTKTNDEITGLYYGTTDEFDEEREGYLAGFFVSPMDKLQINGDTIRFILNTSNSDFLTKPIDLKIKTTKEAIGKGYKNWDNKIPTTPKTYLGLIQDSVTIFFKREKEYLNKTFKKKK